MEPKNYSTIRSILKKEQGEKIAQNKWYSDTRSLSKKRKDYLWNLPGRKKNITKQKTEISGQKNLMQNYHSVCHLVAEILLPL